MESARILVIDNYDSFVYTIVGYLETLGATTRVVRNDATDADALAEALGAREYDGVLVSPGPGQPAAAGVSEDAIRLCDRTGTPMFGVCLGLQALAEVFGARIIHAPTIRHGKTSPIRHEDDEIFAGVPNPMTATRYHSLCVDPDSLPEALQVTARADDDGTIQAIRVAGRPLYAVQFHPESVMTEGGYRLLANWLAAFCGQEGAVAASRGLTPRVAAGASAGR